MSALKYIGITLFVLVVLMIGFAKTERITPLALVSSSDLNTALLSDVVINGYDAVAYHTERKALMGNSAIYSEWKDGKWLFSSIENKAIFDANPKKYAPLFGGYCVYAISKGLTANTDPEVFEIMNGKLILFAAQDVHAQWMKDPANNLDICTLNWND